MSQDFRKITYKEAYSLVSEFHYLGKTRFIGQFCFGYLDDNQLQAAVVYSPLSVPETPVGAFGLSRGHYDYLVEMSRMVMHPDLNGKNLGSQLIAFSLRELKKVGIKAVITYADSSRHVGAVYQAANFTYYGLSAAKKDFYLENGEKVTRGKVKGLKGQWRDRPQKHRYVYVLDKSLKVIWQQQPYPKTNRSAVPQPFRTIPRNTTDTTDQTVPPFPLFRGERGTVERSPLRHSL